MPLELLGDESDVKALDKPFRPPRQSLKGHKGPTGIASLVPTNVRTFVRNLMSGKGDKSSLLNADDFTAEEINEIYYQIAEQDASSRRGDREAKKRLATLQEKTKQDATPEGQAKIKVWADEFGSTASGGRMDELFPHSSEEMIAENNRETQELLDKAQADVTANEKRDKNKTSVTGYKYGRSPHFYAGPGLIKTVMESFSSPAYNISTTLGQYEAFKNADGTVTIKDNYDWTNEEAKWPLKDFLKALPTMLTHPEAMGNALMRTAFKGKGSPVEFDLPPRDSVEMPKEYKHGGRARLI